MRAPWLGSGTMRRGAGGAGGVGGAGVAATVAAGRTVEAAGALGVAAEVAAGAAVTGWPGRGATTATVGLCGGAFFAAASALFRSRIARSASPGFETWDRSNLGFASAAARLLPRLPFLK